MQRLTVAGRRLDRGLGSWPAVSLAQARELGFRNRVTARTGGNPFAGPSNRPTFREAAAKVAEADRARLSATSARTNEAALERYAFPILADRRVNEIGRGEVLRCLSMIWTARPAIARKVRQRIRATLAWAQAHGYVEHNVAGEAIDGALPAMPLVRKHHEALNYRDIPEALQKIASCGASESARAALRYVVLTACRTIEVRGARWSEIDLEERTWTIPATRMKTRREHKVPLSPATLDVLHGVERLRRGDDALVFPSPTGDRLLAKVTLANTMKSAGIGNGTVHGFRSSFRDWCSERTSVPHAVAEMALAHHLGSAVERSYARSDLFEQRRRLMDQWASYVTGGLAKVVRIAT